MKLQALLILRALALGGAGGALCAWLRVPLPWMVGPMLAMAASRFAQVRAEPLPGGRQAGQLVIGCALGLYFTPPVMQQVLANGALMVAAGLAALGVGYVAARAMARVGGIDRGTAFFASVPGGASEMAVLAQRYGASVQHVAVAHSTRILLVVVIVPGVLTLLGVKGDDLYQQASAEFRPVGLAALLALCTGAAWAAQRLRVPNAWVLGPLFLCIVLTVGEVNFSALPGPVSAAGQLLIGLALGARFEPGFIRSSRRFARAVLVSGAVALTLSVLVALLVAWASGFGIGSMALATAPGGIAEMCITAKVLRLGVPMVTAFHVIRFILVVTLTGPLYRLGRSHAVRVNNGSG